MLRSWIFYADNNENYKVEGIWNSTFYQKPATYQSSASQVQSQLQHPIATVSW